MRSFFLEPAKWAEPFSINGQEAKRIAKVLRLKAGLRGAGEVCRAGKDFRQRFLLWEGAGSGRMLKPEDLQPGEDALFVMGPEGGLSAREVEIFTRHGFRPVSLGRRVLRWETAAVLCLGLAWWTNEINFSLSRK